MSKNQALKELKDGYDEQSHTYSEALASLSKEFIAFREESMTKTKEGELVGGYCVGFQTTAYWITKISRYIHPPWQISELHCKALKKTSQQTVMLSKNFKIVCGLFSIMMTCPWVLFLAKSLNAHLEDKMKAKNEELSFARNQAWVAWHTHDIFMSSIAYVGCVSSELQDKLKTFEETLAPNLERMMGDMIQ